MKKPIDPELRKMERWYNGDFIVVNGMKCCYDADNKGNVFVHLPGVKGQRNAFRPEDLNAMGYEVVMPKKLRLS